MGLYQRSDSGVWWMTYNDEDGHRIRRSTRTRDKRAAERIYGNALRAVDERRGGGMAADPLGRLLSLEQLVERYLAERAAAGKGRTWTRTIRWRLLRACDLGRWRRPADLTVASIDRVLGGLDIGATTYNDWLGTIRGLCRWLMVQRPPLLAADPTVHIARRRARRDPRRLALTDAEAAALLAICPPTPSGRCRRACYALALEAGLRRADIRQLRVGQVRLGGAAPYLELSAESTKSGRYETVPATGLLVDALAPLLERRGRRALVVSLDGVRPRIVTCARLRADLAAAGVALDDALDRRVDLHALRHTFVTRLARAGVHPKVAQRLARHRQLATTMDIYTHTGYSDGVEAIGKLADLRQLRPTGTEPLPFPGDRDD